VNGPNMQKSKLLLEPKQKKNFEEKKEKIKSTISIDFGKRNKIGSKSSAKYKNFGKLESWKL